MNILVISNFYPPAVIGGYESLCKEVVDGLKGRGHRLSVLTSTYGSSRKTAEDGIHRVLCLEGDLHFYKKRDAWLYPGRLRQNLEHLRDLVGKEKPDIVFIWGMWNLSRRLAQEAESLPGVRVVFYLANPWPIEANMHVAFWNSPATSVPGNILKKIIRLPARIVLRQEWRRVELKFEHAPCCSAAQRDQLLEAGVPLKDAPVIYEGIELKHYLDQALHRSLKSRADILSLLFVGILAEHKGVHTAIEALAQLSEESRRRVRLRILGQGHPQYEERLRVLVERYRLTEYVSFQPPIPRSDLPEYLGKYDVLLLPSIWSEPLARIMQEGLASGMVVIGSATGGTSETIVHGANGLLFPAGDANELARQITFLLDRPDVMGSLAAEGVRTALERFDINVMVTSLEDYLEQIHAGVH